jgi:hypothetical protein
LGRALVAAAFVVALAGIVHAGGTGYDRFSAGVQAPKLLRADAPSVTPAVTAGWHGGALPTKTGESVTVFVSDTYAPEQVSPQVWADFFAGLPHGKELSSVTVRVAPIAEVATLCGSGDAAGCYRSNEIVMNGELAGGSPPEDTARHEYGHHIAANRVNPPWVALASGTKRWATAEQICSRVKAGTAYPGDEGDHYKLNPGEAFAEAYRVLAEQKAGKTLSSWGVVDGSFFPDPAALSAVEQDVLKPWLAPTTTKVSGRFLAKGPKRRLLPLVTPLDGQISVELRLPRGRLDTVELLSPAGKVLARGLWSGSSVRRLSFLDCGARRFTLRVTRAGNAGQFALTITRP